MLWDWLESQLLPLTSRNTSQSEQEMDESTPTA